MKKKPSLNSYKVCDFDKFNNFLHYTMSPYYLLATLWDIYQLITVFRVKSFMSSKEPLPHFCRVVE